MTDAPAAFELSHVVHLVRRWGEPAANLDQLREGIASAPVEVLFRHALQYQLRAPGAEVLPPDDFSAWIGGVVQDVETAERLSFVVQGGASPEALRGAILQVLDAVPQKRRAESDAPEGSHFIFLSATSLYYSSGTAVMDADGTVEALIRADAGVWFHHLIEEAWLGEGRTPLLEWLRSRNEERLADWLREAAESGMPIDKARARVLKRWRQSRIATRLADAARIPEDARRETGRQVVASLVRRRRRDGTA